MKIEHIAVASNSESDSDDFFIGLLELEKTRAFTVPIKLMKSFFWTSKEQNIVRYEKDNVSFEVFITEDESQALDQFSHSCLIIENRDELIQKAKQKQFEVIKVEREGSSIYYLFIKDKFGNLYEIKSP
jgi:hypothetical protein